MKRFTSLLIPAALFLALAFWNGAAKEGAAWGAQLFAQLLLPSLLPFFVLSQLLSRLGLPKILERRCGGVMERCFALPGCAAAALVLGLCGGYPLGAATAAALRERGELEQEEAERLLFFCDNTGPSFAVAAMGGGALGSAAAGALLYLVHALSALLLGLLCARGKSCPRRVAPSGEAAPVPPFSKALTESVGAAGGAMLNVGFFVVFFSALLAVGRSTGLLRAAERLLCALTGCPGGSAQTLVWSFFELSGSLGLLRELPLSPATLSLAAFALSWGGLCVHFQSAAVTAGAGLTGKWRLPGKLLQGLLSAGLMYIMSTIIFALRPSFFS